MTLLDGTLAAVLRYLWAAVAATAVQLAILLGPGLVLALALHLVSRFIRVRAWRAFGRAYYYTFGWLGTVLHETGHVLFCLLFAHRITQVKFLDPDPASGDLGHVTHTFDPLNPWQRIGNFFIGIGPILLGAAALVGASLLLVGPEVFAALRPAGEDAARMGTAAAQLAILRDVAAGAWSALAALFAPEHLRDWRFWVFVYLVLAAGSAMELSLPDLRGALEGFALLAGLFALFNLCTVWMGGFFTTMLLGVAGAASVLWVVMLVALVLGLAAALVVWLLSMPMALIRR